MIVVVCLYPGMTDSRVEQVFLIRVDFPTLVSHTFLSHRKLAIPFHIVPFIRAINLPIAFTGF